jgi:hypothetical protein
MHVLTLVDSFCCDSAGHSVLLLCFSVSLNLSVTLWFVCCLFDWSLGPSRILPKTAQVGRLPVTYLPAYLFVLFINSIPKIHTQAFIQWI